MTNTQSLTVSSRKGQGKKENGLSISLTNQVLASFEEVMDAPDEINDGYTAINALIVHCAINLPEATGEIHELQNNFKDAQQVLRFLELGMDQFGECWECDREVAERIGNGTLEHLSAKPGYHQVLMSSLKSIIVQAASTMPERGADADMLKDDIAAVRTIIRLIDRVSSVFEGQEGPVDLSSASMETLESMVDMILHRKKIV